jgi:Glycosyl hydrolase family 95 catalytic domain/Glycoside hydrolase family 95, C-terminal domain
MGSSGQPADQNPILYTGQARFVAEGGKRNAVVILCDRWRILTPLLAEFSASRSNLTISGATTVEIYWDAETNYRYPTQDAWEGEMNKKLDAATQKGFDALKQEAIADVQALIGRAAIDLGQSPSGQADLPIDQRVNNARTNLTDLELITLTWNYGRHLLVASSRNTPSIVDMPPNLIGVWNNGTSAAWGGKFTININIEMNMWPAEQTNLGEMTEPLYELMGVAKPRGKAMAQGLYGCNGTVFHHNLDLWGDPAPTDNFTTSTMWPGGAAWLVQHMADHYRFSGDKAFLQNTAYPFLVDVATFFQCYTLEYEGNRVTGPSLSPENAFFIPSNASVAGQQAAMDVAIEVDNQLMRDVMNEVVEFAGVLGIPDTDPAVVAAKDFLPLIREPRVGSNGQILEWRYEYKETDPGNRHLSPLYGLHPSNQFQPLVNETLFNAAKVLLDHRVASGSGSTGWSRTWLVNQYARALSPDDVWTHIQKWYSTYPTTALWNTDHGAVFQIDGNFGITSGLTEMILQSQTGTIYILPALPADAFPTGSCQGLMARGGFEVDAQWENRQLVQATVKSKLGNDLALRVQDGADFSVDGMTYEGPIKTHKGQQHVVTLGKGKCKHCERSA